MLLLNFYKSLLNVFLFCDFFLEHLHTHKHVQFMIFLRLSPLQNLLPTVKENKIIIVILNGK